MADVEGGRDGAAIRVRPVGAEDVLVEVLVEVADGIIEREDDQLDWFGHIFEF